MQGCSVLFCSTVARLLPSLSPGHHEAPKVVALVGAGVQGCEEED